MRSGKKSSTRNAISKVITLTSTYDHRVIQGAGSGEFLRIIHQLLLGEQNFYDEVFESLRIPYEPVRWSPDIQVNPEEQINKVARIQQLIHSYRVRGHLMADTNPLEYVQRRHPDLDILNHRHTHGSSSRRAETKPCTNSGTKNTAAAAPIKVPRAR